MNQLDELFSEKLSNHTLTPPAGGWNKVEANLSKKNKGIVWMRWAAILILGSLAVTIMWMRNEEPVRELAEKPVQSKSIEQPAQQPLTATLEKEEEADESRNKKVKTARKKSTSGNKVTIQHEVAVNETVTEVEEQSMTLETATEVALTETTEPDQQVATEDARPKRGMVLTYTLDPVVAVPPVTEDAHKSSSLGKVVKFAKDVKNGDSSFGLRDMKDDLLALDLKKKSPTKKH